LVALTWHVDATTGLRRHAQAGLFSRAENRPAGVAPPTSRRMTGVGRSLAVDTRVDDK